MVATVPLEFAAKTDRGLVRSHNEDAIALSPDYGVAILADGMGGYSAGEIASGIATAILKESLKEGLERLQGQLPGFFLTRDKQIHYLMNHCVQQANAAIVDAARLEPRYKGMGTTVVVTLFQHHKLTVAHVGDSRLYRLRQGTLLQMTRDHSLLQEQIDAGLISPEWARHAKNRNLITRAVGIDQNMEVEMHDHLTKPGDLYLLCSDGLSDMLPPEEIRNILMDPQVALDRACDTLVHRANYHGGQDNVSVILIRVLPDATEPVGLIKRLFDWKK